MYFSTRAYINVPIPAFYVLLVIVKERQKIVTVRNLVKMSSHTRKSQRSSARKRKSSNYADDIFHDDLPNEKLSFSRATRWINDATTIENSVDTADTATDETILSDKCCLLSALKMIQKNVSRLKVLP